MKKILRAVPHKFVQIASTIEQFGNLKTMTVEELIGRLKAHEERVRGHVEDNGNQLLLTQKWKARGREGSYGKNDGRDKSKIKCYNCNIFGHYAAECYKYRRDKEQKQEVNLAQVEDDEPALL